MKNTVQREQGSAAWCTAHENAKASRQVSGDFDRGYELETQLRASALKSLISDFTPYSAQILPMVRKFAPVE